MTAWTIRAIAVPEIMGCGIEEALGERAAKKHISKIRDSGCPMGFS
jgi:hypothetical protein